MAYMTIIAVVEVPDDPKFSVKEPGPGQTIEIDLVEEGMAQFKEPKQVRFLTAQPGVTVEAMLAGADPELWPEGAVKGEF
jgi:hypothetical protein